jgi:adenylate cyclase
VADEGARPAADGGAPGPVGDAAALERENRILGRRLHRLEENVRRLEDFGDSNSRLLSQVVKDLEVERARSQHLLLNVLPQRIIDRLNAGEKLIADRHEDVTVLFSDFVGFTEISARLPTAALIDELNDLFSGFDAICEATGVEKIKTIGDAYLAIGGLVVDAGDHRAAIAETALQMVELVAARPVSWANWQVRIGLDSGSVAAGVIGTAKFAYDVWGDAVNVASRLEATSLPGRIHVSDALAAALSDRYRLEPRGALEIKGKGSMTTWFLVGPRKRADRRG